MSRWGAKMDLNLTLRDKLGQQFTFTTSLEILNFFKAEKQYWDEQKTTLGKNLSAPFVAYPQQIDDFLVALKKLKELLAQDLQPNNIQQYKQNFDTAKNQFVNWMSQQWLYRGSPCTEALLDAYKYSQESGMAFWNAISTKVITFQNNRTSLPTFIGNIMAYEFLLQDQSQIVKRRYAEKKAFSTLRSELEQERNSQVTNFDAFRQNYQSWHADAQGEFDEWFAECKKRSDTTIANHSSFFNEMADHAIERHKDLEALYVEKLRLEKPAKYWEDRAVSLRRQGMIWSICLALVLLSGVGYFTYLFTHWLSGQEMTVSLHSLQGAVLLAVIISAFVFCIRVLSRLAFSAFHLQRDAEERQQLAYVYLALSNETHADEESRKIVLQALFSRAETGLLASESGPTMPGVDGLAGLITKTTKT